MSKPQLPFKLAFFILAMPILLVSGAIFGIYKYLREWWKLFFEPEEY